MHTRTPTEFGRTMPLSVYALFDKLAFNSNTVSLVLFACDMRVKYVFDAVAVLIAPVGCNPSVEIRYESKGKVPCIFGNCSAKYPGVAAPHRTLSVASGKLKVNNPQTRRNLDLFHFGKCQLFPFWKQVKRNRGAEHTPLSSFYMICRYFIRFPYLCQSLLSHRAIR